MRILILNCYSRNSLAVINSLDPHYELIGGTSKKEKYLFCNPDRFFKSKRLKKIFRYTDPRVDPEGFKKDIINACKLYKPDAVIPTGTTVTNSLSYYKNEINKHTDAKLLVEDYSTLSQLADKWLTYQICLKIGVPTPKTVLLNSNQQVMSLINSFNFPIILKPRMEYAAKGILFFNKKEELKSYLEKSPIFRDGYNQQLPPYIAQEVIRGELHDVTACAKDGIITSILSQQRLVSLYDFGGGGIINKTTYEPTIMEYAKRIIKFVRWNGVILFDFIKDQEGNYFLLECNPKIWGTTQLTIEAGLNVVQQLIDYFVINKPIEIKDDYKTDLVYKWLFPECIFHWIQPPRTVNRVSKRIFRTLRKYNAKESLNNLTTENLLHLIGIVLDRSEL
jgi:carbamoylphosphate synthase large subunit